MILKTIYTWFLIALLILISYFAIGFFFGIKVYADDDATKYIQQSAIDPRKEVIHDADGDAKGYLQQSPIDPRKTVQYDKNGNIEGVWRKSYIDPRKRIFIPK